jgi:hypothetical protein
MTLAERLGHAGPIVELMRRMTHREYEVWIEWIKDNQGHPSRSDWYAMQIAAEIRRLRMKTPAVEGYDPNVVKLADMKLSRDDPKPKTITREQAADQAKSRWFGWLKIKR